jgi:Ca-activated chloride channel family protein
MSDLDEGALREISRITGGHFYRADDLKTAESAFKAIDKAQKIEFQAKSYLITTELFLWPATPGLVALILAALLSVARRRANAVSVTTTRNTVPTGRVVSSVS